MHAAFEDGARSAGKDPGGMPIITESSVVVSDDPAEVQAGATHVFVHSPEPDQMRAIQSYGQQVLPML